MIGTRVPGGTLTEIEICWYDGSRNLLERQRPTEGMTPDDLKDVLWFHMVADDGEHIIDEVKIDALDQWCVPVSLVAPNERISLADRMHRARLCAYGC